VWPPDPCRATDRTSDRRAAWLALACVLIIAVKLVSYARRWSSSAPPLDATTGQRLIADANLVAMRGSTTCPGCGLELPTTSSTWDPHRNASPECWQLYGEVQGFELHHIQLVRDYHQLAVDAYAVAAAGAMVNSVASHAEAVRAWAAAVWRAWASQHAAVATLADRLLL
jgi:Family of unknown function (DUF5946)